MNNQGTKAIVTTVLHEQTGVMTAFFTELPGLVVQGKSREDVKDKLKVLLTAYLKRWETMSNDFEIEPQNVI